MGKNKSVFVLEVEVNAEGKKLAYLGKKGAGDCYRIAGPKAWGGSTNMATLEISESDLVTFLAKYAPEVAKAAHNQQTGDAQCAPNNCSN